MSPLVPAEQKMWHGALENRRVSLNDDEINEKYTKRELRIITEVNREQLPNFVAALQRSGWMDVRPFYQRRERWDETRQSKLIESFIMNVPIPPLFVFESDFAKYEVMDGQQRITAIRDFYSNKLKLKGLEQWPELNGRIYGSLPSAIRKGIDRRSISYIVLLKESAMSSEEEVLLRQQVFERLNTGGIKLSKQEIRNSLYSGPFNDMLLQLAKDDLFRDTWGIPVYTSSETANASSSLRDNTLWSQMGDVEIILRFFALRHADQYRRGMAGFLDLYALRSRSFPERDIEWLRQLFLQTLYLAHEIYRKALFRPWDSEKEAWSAKPQLAFSDVVMVGLSDYINSRDYVLSKSVDIVNETQKLFVMHEPSTFTGRGNSKSDVEQRIKLFKSMLTRTLGV